MTDKELLELAAKAEGRTWMSYSTGSGKGLCCRDTRFGGLIEYYWNPITDDGDALRLAVNLKSMLVLDIRREFIEVVLSSSEIVREINKGDPYSATRRAIVRAAAEIGKEMK